jgi:transposase
VIDRVESGASRHDAAEHKEVSPSTAVIWVKYFRETGRCAAKSLKRERLAIGVARGILARSVQWQLDVTLGEVIAAMRRHKVPGSRTAVFQRHKLTFKKSLACGGAAARRGRLVGRVSQGLWKTITFVAALRRHGMRASQTIDGAMTGKKFPAYVEQRLTPTLKLKDIIMMDNFPAHKAAGVREAIDARGATLRYLPKYSPDLNPIEMPFSKLKADLRKAAERTIPRLRRRIGRFAATLTAREASNYFRHAGYA